MEILAIETFYPKSKKEWRQWLEENHQSKKSIWLIQYKKSAANPSITWGESVDEALCFGWIDSIRKSLDDESFIQFYSKRKPKSAWSKINKAKVEHLIAEGLMTPAGFESIEVAKQNGSWTLLDDVEELLIPADLEQAFEIYPGAKEYFSGHSKSIKKMMLQWVSTAKRIETREKRIIELAEIAGKRQKPKQF